MTDRWTRYVKELDDLDRQHQRGILTKIEYDEAHRLLRESYNQKVVAA